MSKKIISELHANIPQLLFEIHAKLKKEGFQSYIVGGAVRDLLLNRPILDWDMNTDAQPQQLLRIFPRAIPTGIEHGTLTIVKQNQTCELTSFRIDGEYSDNRRPDSVSYNATLINDLSRRDFTINAMVYDFEDRCIIDPFEGQLAIKTREIRCVGNPKKRIGEDYLRILRALRFASQLAFHIEEKLFDCIIHYAPNIKTIARERITTEMKKLISTVSVSYAMEYLARSNILVSVFDDNLFHLTPATANALGEALSYSWQKASNEVLQWAVLFSMIYACADRLYPRYLHSNLQHLARSLKKLRLSNRESKNIRSLIHAVHFLPRHTWTDSQLRHYLAYAKVDVTEHLIVLLHCCHAAFHRVEQRLHSLVHTYIPFSHLAVNGSMLITQAKCKEGRAIGLLLRKLHRIVLAHPEKNTAEQLLSIARSLLR